LIGNSSKVTLLLESEGRSGKASREFLLWGNEVEGKGLFKGKGEWLTLTAWRFSGYAFGAWGEWWGGTPLTGGDLG